MSVKPADVFISHAREDKEDIARPLAEALRRHGFVVWYDEYVLRLGDSLRQVIDKGLSSSRFGVVILSPSFFSKEWPQRELNGFLARETANGSKVLLPVWHKITFEEVAQFSPLLADKLAVSTARGFDFVVQQILQVLERDLPRRNDDLASPASTRKKLAPSKPASIPVSPASPSAVHPPNAKISRGSRGPQTSPASGLKRQNLHEDHPVPRLQPQGYRRYGTAVARSIERRRYAAIISAIASFAALAVALSIVPWSTQHRRSEDLNPVQKPGPSVHARLVPKLLAYDPGSRRDPFKSLFAGPDRSKFRGPRPEGVPGLTIAEIDLIGIFRTSKGFVAQVEAANQRKSYLLKEGDRLYDGDVVSINRSEVIFKQIVEDPAALEPFREVTKILNPSSGVN